MSTKHLEQGSEFPPFSQHKLRLYSMRFCPFSERVRLMLAAKHIPYEIININLKKKPDWFSSRHTSTPVIEYDDGLLLHESLIVCTYLDEAYDAAHPLTSKDPFEKAKQAILVEQFGKIVEEFNKSIRNVEGSKDQLITNLKSLEKKLNGDYFGGEKEAIVDYMIWPWFERLSVLEQFAGIKLDSNEFPKLIKWVERMKNLPAVKEVMLRPEIFIKFYKDYLNDQPNYDVE